MAPENTDGDLAALAKALVDQGWTPPGYQAVPSGYEATVIETDPEATVARLAEEMSAPGHALSLDELLGVTPEVYARMGRWDSAQQTRSIGATVRTSPWLRSQGGEYECPEDADPPEPHVDATPTLVFDPVHHPEMEMVAADDKIDKIRDQVVDLTGRVNKLEE